MISAFSRFLRLWSLPARMGCGPDRLFEFGLKQLLIAWVTFSSGKRSQFPIRTRRNQDCICALPDSCRPSSRMSKRRLLSHRAVGQLQCRDRNDSGCWCQNTGVAWFDAHGESTTPDTTTSGSWTHGISISPDNAGHTGAFYSGFSAVPGGHILLVGARDLESAEFAFLTRQESPACREPSISDRCCVVVTPSRRFLPAFRSGRTRSDPSSCEPMDAARRVDA